MYRRACAIQSAAIHNPNRDIFVLFASPVAFNWKEGDSFENLKSTSPIFKIFSLYPNIYLRNVNMTTFAVGTPIEELEKRGDVYASKFNVSHLSDVIRLVILYKYGGLYLDADFIILRNLDDIASTFFATESVGLMSNGAIGFTQNGFGHDLLDTIMR